MRLLSATVLLTLLAAAGAALAAPAPTQIEIPSGKLDLHAQLYKPDGNGPFPVVIALHGCDGLAGQGEVVAPRYREWAELFVKAGYAVLLPDSFASREVGPQCREKERKVLARRERVGDVTASHKWLLAQSWVARDRISLVGWAHGASTVLWAVRPQLAARGKEPDFRSAIAFYPQCRVSARTGWSARVPTLLLIGANDDISAPSLCKQMVDGARGRSALTRIEVYPDAWHDFDRAGVPLRTLDGSDPAAPDHGHIGTDAGARADAQRRVAEWLAR
ncbi:MAG: prolyl oligopeptidase family serine peptidase [Bradyrhizobium sp.]|nr:prolyl oligopeptidase family serine peptidase [Bradyrhizobium sp.]